ncbi:hypothetical protein ACFL13_03110, partial [Patescibacteria group bacterium]
MNSFSTHTYGVFSIYAALDKGHMGKFLNIVKNTIDEVTFKDVPMSEHVLVKNKVSTDILFELEKTSRRASFLSELFLHDQVTKNLNKEIENYQAVTLLGVRKTAEKLFKQNPKISILGSNIYPETVER